MNAEPKKVKLSVPITVEVDGGGHAVISEITIGRIKAKHIEFIPQAVFDGKNINPVKIFPLIAALTGLSTETLGELDYADLTDVISEVVAQLGEKVASGQTGGS